MLTLWLFEWGFSNFCAAKTVPSSLKRIVKIKRRKKRKCSLLFLQGEAMINPPPLSDNKIISLTNILTILGGFRPTLSPFCGHAQYFSYSLLLSFDTSVTFLCCIFSLLMKFSIDGQGENSESNLKKLNPIKLHSVSKLL